MLGFANSRLAVQIANDAMKQSKKNKAAPKSSSTISTSSPTMIKQARAPSRRPSRSSSNASTVTSSTTSSPRTADWPAPRSIPRRSKSSDAAMIKKPAERLPAKAPKTLRTCTAKASAEAFEHASNDSFGIPTSITLVNKEQQEAEQILGQISQALNLLQNQDADLTQTYNIHNGRAQGRMGTNNSVGALLSIKKIYKVQAQRHAIQKSVNFLFQQQTDIQEALEEYRQVCDLMQVPSSPGSSSSRSASPPQMHLNLDAAREMVEQILNEKQDSQEEHCSLSDDELLAWFQQQEQQ